MKAIITFSAVLMIVSVTFAQPSRRSTETRDNGSSNQNSQKREAPSNDNQKSTNNTRSETSVTNRRVRPDNNTQAPSQYSGREHGNQSNTREYGRNENNNGREREYERGRGRDNDHDRDRDWDRNRGRGREVNVHVERNVTVIEPRHHVVSHPSYRPVPVEVRRVRYPYRTPVHIDVFWTVDLCREYQVYYPTYRWREYRAGMRIASVPAYDANNFVGDITRVYGRVVDTYYSWETDEYFLYFGDYYPYQDFSVVIPGDEARDFSRRPESYFLNQYMSVTGLISRFEGKPEMVIKRSRQIEVY